MKIGILGLYTQSKEIINVASLEDAENMLKNKELDILIVGNNFPSCACTRDIVLFSEQKLYKEFKNLDEKVKIIFIR